MNILLRQALILDPASVFHQQHTDLHIRDGIIQAIGNDLAISNATIVDLPGLCVSTGFTDIFTSLCDPGYEHKETLQTGAAAAAAGGYTDIFSLPNTQPAVHNRAAVEYLVQGARFLPVSVHPIGAVTKNIEGKELSEMYDMRNSGALAFGDGTSAIQPSGILLKALQYLKAIDAVLIQVPDDKSISAHGLMNESVVSTQMGLAGKPAIAEELMISRDIKLVRYTGGKIHFTGISTAKSLHLVRKAKEEGLAVTCSVTPYHLYFTEEDLQGYDTNLKVNPPIRSAADRDALRQGVLDGSIDCIASHHQPHEKDSKIVEFEYARNGMTSLETAFGVVRTAVPDITATRLAELFSTNAREIFGLQRAGITENAPASLTLFQMDAVWQVNVSDTRSKSVNTPFHGQSLKGKIAGIINKGQIILNK
ncbi:dihydroorotase [Cnuella takakiae]|uniref:Dihydroorotase n=1 Tax=Cnuella takakiae TaxID=1302690 RepID=A0A1M5HEP4_9BACT|nr:dihydroorotase [Cnuella takakiae]OLY92844.1 dihydroorotase [Cnuella takakiae]SHG14401.1 dihydroorotase [Cnuella takakiae]